MLKSLLKAITQSPTSSSLELRTKLELSRETYEQLLGHLVRLGYVRSELLEEPGCPTHDCHGCPLACQSAPALGPRVLTITAAGERFLGK